MVHGAWCMVRGAPLHPSTLPPFHPSTAPSIHPCISAQLSFVIRDRGTAPPAWRHVATARAVRGMQYGHAVWTVQWGMQYGRYNGARLAPA